MTAVAAASPGLPEVSLHSMKVLIAARLAERRMDEVVVDLRAPHLFGCLRCENARIPTSVNIPFSAVKQWLRARTKIDPAKTSLVFYSCGSASRRADQNKAEITAAANLAIAAGFKASVFPAGWHAWRQSPLEFKEVSLEYVKALALAKIAGQRPDEVLIDVRTDQEWTEGHIPGAIQMELVKFNTLLRAVDCPVQPGKHKLILHCRSGKRSLMAHYAAEAMGFEVAHYEGGWHGYIKAPLTQEQVEAAKEGRVVLGAPLKPQSKL